MPVAIGSPTFSSAICSGTSTSGLEAQLTRHQKALSEQVNCSSAKTPEGKAAIADISNKISTVKTRIEEIANTQPSRYSTTLIATDVNKTNEAAAKSGVGAALAPKSADATVGSRLDVFA
ncbi:hypothetical protein SCT_2038 [Sulfuricella sp. T08]|uniref:hypothetical protein n=1 Tax=Sulfuricella sp. T08 TaxID=1632857 RepID=UPI0006179AE2|nr:hypothetical protein [Sulfuricella sp. T08]GAO36629.1 hypothetical protein SCT_2038 [Sulfuricella sp. T08]